MIVSFLISILDLLTNSTSLAEKTTTALEEDLQAHHHLR